MIFLTSDHFIFKFLLLVSLSISTLFADGLVLSEDEKEWIKQNKNINYAGHPNWLPYEAFNENGHYIGMAEDYIETIQHNTGLYFIPHSVNSWSESLGLAEEGKVSVVSGDIADPILNKNFKPIRPYLINPIVIIMNQHALDVDNNMGSLESLHNKKVVIVKDYGYTQTLIKSYPTINFIEVENIQDGLRGVSTGKYDAILASNTLARYSISKMKLYHLKVAGKTSVLMSLTLFVDKNEPMLYSIIQKTIASISTEKEEEIRNKWTYSDNFSLNNPWTLLTLLVVFLTFIVLLKLYRKAIKAKELYVLAMEGSKDALWNWDIKENISYFSPRFNEILGIDIKECFSKDSSWTDRIHPDDKAAVLVLIDDNLKGNTNTLDTQYRIRNKEGKWIWMQVRAKTFYDFEGNPSRMDGVCRDISKEKELSLQLIESRQLLSTIIDNIPIRIFWKDLNGTYLGYNKLFAMDIDGKGNYDYIGKTDFDMPWKDEAQGYVDDDREVITTGIAKLNIEEQQTRPDGNKEWLTTSKVPLVNDAGDVYGVIGVYYDITERKMHQLENEKITLRLETAQELSHMGSWEWDMHSGDLSWSDEVYRIFGEEPQSFAATYEAFVSYIPKEYQQGLQDAIDEAIKTKKTYEYDHEIRRKDGTLRLVREAGYVRYDKNGQAISMLGTIMDINSIVMAESAVRENKELTRRLQKFDENIIASNTDTNGIITYASEAFVNISGYSLDELIGSPQGIVRHEDMKSEVFEDLWKTIQSGKEWFGEIKNKAKDGSAYWVETTISPTLNSKGDIIGYASIRRDVTHEKQVNQLHASLEKKSLELQILNKDLERRIEEAVLESKEKDHIMAQQSKLASMGEMIGNIAHQWRQPLNALGLLLQKQQVYFERGLLTSQKVQESTDKGVKLINKMSTTIDDFRDFFKPDKKKENFDIKNAITSSLELIDAALYDKNIELVVNVDEGNIIYGYENEFSQVILNIINNAKDVLVENEIENSTIKIETSKKDDKVSIYIADNGGGIPDNAIEKVFEPYFTTKEEGKGTGIGLYMSKMIIEDNMNGKIQVENTQDGALFTLTFDIISQNPKEQKEIV